MAVAPGKMVANTKGALFGRPLIQFSRALQSGLQRLNVLCLPALWALYDIELNLLAFLKAAETVRLDGGEVNENVFTILAADEPVTLGVVKPLYCSCFHGSTLFPLF
jgi:hypothetical protein